MGNTNSTCNLRNPDCDIIFDNEIVSTSDITNIIITLTVPAVNNKRHTYNKYLLSTFGTDKIWFYPLAEGDIIPPADQTYYWSPQSYVTKDEVTLGKNITHGRGIGVIVIEPAQKYVKLYYRNNEFGIKPLYGLWDHEEGCRNSIERDIELGYDVLVINHIGELHFNKSNDGKDEVIIDGNNLMTNDENTCDGNNLMTNDFLTNDLITNDGNDRNDEPTFENPFVETDENSTSKISKTGLYIINLQNYHEHVHNLTQKQTTETSDIITLQ